MEAFSLMIAPGAEKPYPGYHLGGDPGGIDPHRSNAAEIAVDPVDIDRYYREQAGTERNQEVRPETGRPAMDLAFQPDERPQYRCKQEFRHHFQVKKRSHETSLFSSPRY